ncbi:MAG: fibronectin type III domain-containing protein, partial [Candidatus Diapherotrites archaeon]|nr:fibronectin type III domain-containing protein [Candidatus Diapherotrites archaeon]
QAPLNPLAVALEGNKIQLSWEPARDDHSGIGGYKIYRAFLREFEIDADYVTVIAEKIEGASYVDEDLGEGKTYHYRVQSVDAVGNFGGVSRSFFARVGTKCDFDPAIETTLVDGNLSISIDSSPYLMRFATLVLRPAVGEPIEVFRNKIDFDFLSGSVDVSNFVDQEILLDFDVKDESDDVCDKEQVFYLDSVLPDGEWVFPVENSVLTENVLLKVKAFDFGGAPSGISGVEFFLGESLLGQGIEGEGGEFFFDWNSLSVENGRVQFVAKIFDKAQNFVEKKVLATVKNTALISAQVSALILEAEEGKVAAEQVEKQLKSIGVVSAVFEELFNNADSTLERGKKAFSAGVNFERAKADAVESKALFDRAVSLLSIEKTDTVHRVFAVGGAESMFRKVGLAPHLVQEAKEAVKSFAPVRRMDVFEVSDENGSFFKVVFVLSVSGANSGNILLLEVIPKSLSERASDFSSSSDFSVLTEDPLIKFDLDLNESSSVSYFFSKNFSKSELDELLAKKPLELFESLPIVLSAETKVDSDTVKRPVDLFEIFGSLTKDIDSFTLLLIVVGIIVVLLVVVGIISFFVVLLAFLKKQR